MESKHLQNLSFLPLPQGQIAYWSIAISALSPVGWMFNDDTLTASSDRWETTRQDRSLVLSFMSASSGRSGHFFACNDFFASNDWEFTEDAAEDYQFPASDPPETKQTD